jgi:REP element-mobilizing transposase RayT
MAHGGVRKGAGRKKSVRRGGPHRRRPEISARHAVHVVLRINGGSELRQGKAYNALRVVLRALLDATDYRIVHISIQNNHLHLLVEAANKRALQSCMQRFTIRAARALQAAMGWHGKVFPWRYHATQIKTARQARNTLAYVLNNWRRHREDIASATTRAAAVDPYSSGILFDGWIGSPLLEPWPGYLPPPVSAPRSTLLRSEWKRCGLIDLFERPGPVAFADRRGPLS